MVTESKLESCWFFLLFFESCQIFLFLNPLKLLHLRAELTEYIQRTLYMRLSVAAATMEVGLVSLRSWWSAHSMYIPPVFRDQIAQKWVGCQLDCRLFRNQCCQRDERLFYSQQDEEEKRQEKKLLFRAFGFFFFCLFGVFFTSECSSACATSSCRRFCAVCRLCFWTRASATTEKHHTCMRGEGR